MSGHAQTGRNNRKIKEEGRPGWGRTIETGKKVCKQAARADKGGFAW